MLASDRGQYRLQHDDEPWIQAAVIEQIGSAAHHPTMALYSAAQTATATGPVQSDHNIHLDQLRQLALLEDRAQ